MRRTGPGYSAQYVSLLYVFEPDRNNTWTRLPDTAAPQRRRDAAFAAFDGRLWCFGGWTDLVTPYGSVLADLYQYDPARAAWVDMTSLVRGAAPQARAGHALITAAGKLYSFGGYTNWPGPTARLSARREREGERESEEKGA